jgi:hypothetical protein
MPPEHVAADGHAPTGDLPLAALWRTRSYLRPYLSRLILMLVAACLAVGAEILIPLLTKYIVDGRSPSTTGSCSCCSAWPRPRSAPPRRC